MSKTTTTTTKENQPIRRRVSERFTNAQSEKSVLDLLEMSISCIFFLRGFFNDSFFKEDKFYIDKHEISKSKRDFIRIKMLNSNMSPESDTILNWIRISVADALQKKYLKAIDLSISLDEKDTTNVSESYIFNVNYNESSGETISFNDELILSPSELTRMSIFKLMKKLILLTQSLSPLPTQRYLFMRILFNDTCPKNYNPEYFSDCSEEKSSCIKIPISLVDDLKTTCGEVNSVHHTLSTHFISLSTLEHEDLHKKEMIEIDPFDLFNEEKIIKEKEAEMAVINTQVSQVTKDLYDMLKNFNNEIHDGETQVADSCQNETLIKCTCQSNKYLPYSSTIQCSSCLNIMHKTCYAINTDVQKFKCYNCSKDKSIPINDMYILFSIRKLLSYFQEKAKNSIKSITDAANIIGFDNVSDMPAVVDAISVLIFEGIISFKTQKSFNHSAFNVEMKGILVENKQIKPGKYFISFVTKNNKEKINQFLDPSFGKVHEIMDSLVVGDDNNETTVVEDDNFDYDVPLNEFKKKRKIAKSIDILNI
ncbi:hypothetical protein CANINC_002613 [Pichia inconspicua]|uniref:HORMA domain-containing protein n=1 Tax=Pichia inconspicua TaxID=52247 RepID=A0A4T0X2A5_9ASCO|nr:hypothetical protein CANINC_002613 [[Candida] inconspicua]